MYLKAAELMAKDINTRCRVTCGFATLKDVAKRRDLTDEMESFFLSETLKYLYFIFAKGVEVYWQDAKALAELYGQCLPEPGVPSIDPGKYVFTTEGHFVPLIRLDISLDDEIAPSNDVCSIPDYTGIN
jgi:hypothetical protein